MSTKDTVLELFEKNRGFFVSGERIASDLGISRTAVWKAVKKLRSEGYEIEAVTNRGYCLAKNSDILSVQGIRNHLDEDARQLRPEVFVTVDSTNNVCMKKAANGEDEGYTAIAGAQTMGRGRRGRGFFSPADTGIYMSIILKPAAYPGTQVLRLTTMAAVAVCEAIEALSDKQPAIKWVNDIYIDGKKVCGILSEASYGVESGSLDAVVVGIGINAYYPRGGFPPELAEKAGCVFDETSAGNRNRLAAEILNRFMFYYNKDTSDDHFEKYRNRSLIIGRDIEILNKTRASKAHVLGLDENCGLIVRYPDGTEGVLHSGEVSITGMDL
jgi:BirA family biotin operon repressor/biotin-[acetyl-CoA-carboxylase] ligase